jgi:hypothetical protein
VSRCGLECCEHCGCVGAEREGHDDTCAFGCNDEIEDEEEQ